MKRSAGLLLYKIDDGQLRVLLVHPGGPFYARKDDGAWSIPKGEVDEDEDLLTTARREFAEEMGRPAPETDELMNLGESKQPGGKVNYIWAVETEFDVSHITSNTFEMEWPPKSGQIQSFPEVDRAEWFSAGTARTKLRQAQLIFLDRLEEKLNLPASQATDDNPQTSLL